MKAGFSGEYLGPRGSGERRRFLDEELRSLYRSPNIVRVIKSRRFRRAGHVAGMEEESRRAFKILIVTSIGKVSF